MRRSGETGKELLFDLISFSHSLRDATTSLNRLMAVAKGKDWFQERTGMKGRMEEKDES